MTSETALRQRAVLSPMQVPKASEVLANELRESILSGKFPEGTTLPTERDMVSQTKVSAICRGEWRGLYGIRDPSRYVEFRDLLRDRFDVDLERTDSSRAERRMLIEPSRLS